MKKIISLALLFCLLCCACLARGEEAPTMLDQSELAGISTHYLLYDRDFYEAPDEHPGTVVKMKYTTNMYDKAYKKYLNVYLPYGYDENGTERYPVIYFYHGRGCNPDTLIGNEATKNAFDHMISSGIVRPFILVTPTYYYGRGTNYDSEKFVQEFRQEIMPLVEGTYRTYAEIADEAGFQASRDYRAICGFSMGSMVTWSLFGSMLDVSAYFLPFSGASADLETMHGILDHYDGRFFIYMASGDPEDGAFEGCASLARSFAADSLFSYGPDFKTNNIFYVASDNIHQDLTSRYYLYNAFLDGLFQE